MIKSDKKYRIFIAVGAMAVFLLLVSYIAAKSPPEEFQVEILEKALSDQENVIDYVNDETMVYAIVSKSQRSDYGDVFVVFEEAGKGDWKRIYENDFHDLKPWKLEQADLDGDKEKEILIAVKKTTRFDPVEKNRLFIFNYKNGKLVKKWTGSDIAGTWVNFFSGDLLSIPGDELMFVEKAGKEGEKISIYYWFDFGFLRLAESRNYKDIEKFSILNKNRIQISYGGEVEEKTELTVKDGKIVEIIN